MKGLSGHQLLTSRKGMKEALLSPVCGDSESGGYNGTLVFRTGFLQQESGISVTLRSGSYYPIVQTCRLRFREVSRLRSPSLEVQHRGSNPTCRSLYPMLFLCVFQPGYQISALEKRVGPAGPHPL